MRQFFDNLRKQHKIFFITIILSFLISCLFFIVEFYLIAKFDILRNIYLFIMIPIIFLPCGLVTLVSYIGTKIANKYPILTNLIGLLINLVLMYFTYLFIGLLLIYLLIYIGIKPYTNVIDYNRALKSVSEPQEIMHFPKKIPDNAKNIDFVKGNDPAKNSEFVSLSFDTDEKYINAELAKYNCQKELAFKSSFRDFKFCKIGEIKYRYNDEGYGIGYNKTKTRILYYH